VAVQVAVPLVEQVHKPLVCVRAQVACQLRRDLDRYFVRLAEVAHVDLVADHDLLQAEAELLDPAGRLPRELREGALQPRGVGLRTAGHVRAMGVVPRIGGDQSYR
jgi:hypothetical protein